MRKLVCSPIPKWPAAWACVGAAAILAGACGLGDDAATTHPVPLPAYLSQFAGNLGGPGNADGIGKQARFSEPWAVATDAAGNVYVADTDNNTIRKITPTGTVSTLAGAAGVAGSSDGTGTAARFAQPKGLATDRAGYVYVADTGNHTIRKIAPDGVVSTLAGLAGTYGSADGSGAEARFKGPTGIAIDGAGNVYVAETGEVDPHYGGYWVPDQSIIRKITPDGVVTSLAGRAGVPGSADGMGADASFNGPTGIATDARGIVYVADAGNRAIRRITPEGLVSTVGVLFGGANGVTIDGAGNIYVAQTGGNKIQKLTPDGVLSIVAGPDWGNKGSTDGTGGYARFNGPRGITIDSGGRIHVADTGNSTIRSITPDGVVSTVAGQPAVAGSEDGSRQEARFNEPTGITLDSGGNVFVAESLNSDIRKITAAGVVSTLGVKEAGEYYASHPNDVAVDDSGNLYWTDGWWLDPDTASPRVKKRLPSGIVNIVASGGICSSPQFWQLSGIAIDRAGSLYVADTKTHTIRKITQEGAVSTLAGKPLTCGCVSTPRDPCLLYPYENPGSQDGVGSSARFRSPADVAIDSAGNVYVADTGNHTIRKISPDGAVSTLAGSAGVSGAADGTPAEARFHEPRSIAIDTAGNVYVADTGNHTIRKITPAGIVTTIAGVAGRSGFTPGELPGLLASPRGVAVHGTSLYVTLYNGIAVVDNLP